MASNAVDLKKLRAFYLVAKLGSLTKVAETRFKKRAGLLGLGKARGSGEI